MVVGTGFTISFAVKYKAVNNLGKWIDLEKEILLRKLTQTQINTVYIYLHEDVFCCVINKQATVSKTTEIRYSKRLCISSGSPQEGEIAQI